MGRGRKPSHISELAAMAGDTANFELTARNEQTKKTFDNEIKFND